MSDSAIQSFTGVEYVVHESFRKGVSYDWDIAMLRLQPVRLDFNDHVQPVCLPSVPARPNDKCVVAGWTFRQSKLVGTRLKLHVVTIS